MKMEESCNSKDRKCPEPCPICLDPLKEEAYLDRCFHAFCYPCIVHWSNVVAKKQARAQSSVKCPICKTENFSIVHSFDGENFRQHFLRQDQRKYHLSGAHEFRLHWYSNIVCVPCSVSDVHQYWKLRRYFRRNVWLESWLRREIQALTQEEDVEVIVHHIHGAIENFFRRQHLEGMKDVIAAEKQKAFRALLSDIARPFLLGRTDRFVNEVEMFLVLGLNIDAYDALCRQCLADLSGLNEAESTV